MTKSFAAVSFVALLSMGCGDDAAEVEAPAEPVGEMQNVTMVNCEVCGDHEFAKQVDTPETTYAGEAFYFCAEGCKTAFEKDPTKYVSVAPSTRPASASS